MIIYAILCTGEDFFNLYFLPLYKSLKANTRFDKVICYFNDIGNINEIKQKYPDIEFVQLMRNTDTWASNTKYQLETSYQLCQKISEDDLVFYLDADMIINKDLTSLVLNEIKSYDCLFTAYIDHQTPFGIKDKISFDGIHVINRFNSGSYFFKKSMSVFFKKAYDLYLQLEKSNQLVRLQQIFGGPQQSVLACMFFDNLKNKIDYRNPVNIEGLKINFIKCSIFNQTESFYSDETAVYHLKGGWRKIISKKTPDWDLVEGTERSKKYSLPIYNIWKKYYIKVLSEIETIQEIQNGKSIGRYGDGELINIIEKRIDIE